MNQDDVIRMAKEAGGPYVVMWRDGIEMEWADLERFAALVAAHEREECAKVCDAKVEAEYATGKVDHNEMGWTQYCSMAIRLREKKQA
jgi:hypothetical protein